MPRTPSTRSAPADGALPPARSAPSAGFARALVSSGGGSEGGSAPSELKTAVLHHQTAVLHDLDPRSRQGLGGFFVADPEL
jgi:hypothetical protein